jgi:hypothetical protein
MTLGAGKTIIPEAMKTRGFFLYCFFCSARLAAPQFYFIASSNT